MRIEVSCDGFTDGYEAGTGFGVDERGTLFIRGELEPVAVYAPGAWSVARMVEPQSAE